MNKLALLALPLSLALVGCDKKAEAPADTTATDTAMTTDTMATDTATPAATDAMATDTATPAATDTATPSDAPSE